MHKGDGQGVVENDRMSRDSSTPPMRSRLALLVRGTSVTTHCHAATALLTRAYQGDHRRTGPDLERVLPHPLDKSFHIRWLV